MAVNASCDYYRDTSIRRDDAQRRAHDGAVTRASRATPRVTGHTGLRGPHVCGPAGEIPENMRPPRNFANAMIAAARRRCAVVVPDFEHTSSSPRPPRRVHD